MSGLEAYVGDVAVGHPEGFQIVSGIQADSSLSE
jgi:hypothetical protein